jgi:hypothetical protein
MMQGINKRQFNLIETKLASVRISFLITQLELLQISLRNPDAIHRIKFNTQNHETSVNTVFLKSKKKLEVHDWYTSDRLTHFSKSQYLS